MKLHRAASMVLLFVVSGLSACATIPPRWCALESRAGEVCPCSIRDLRPTQGAVGQREVERKKSELQGLSPDELAERSLKDPEVAVVGPGGRLYVIDHHHLGKALAESSAEKAYCRIEENLSAMDPEAFFQELTKRKWIHPYDENGKGPKRWNELPASLMQMPDDPYRSLAGVVRRSKGYAKSPMPFAEFQWANFFRTRIPRETLARDFDAAVAQGLELARSSEARSLPGYLGPARK